MAIMIWIGTSVSMTETWTSTTLASIGYYGRDLDIDNFGQNWANYGHETTLGIFIFFSTREK